MAYDSFNYDIKSKMPEWWREDTLLEPINRYSQKLIRDLVGGLLENIGVVQPVQVWKTLPTEYSWTHSYMKYDPRLKNEQGVPSDLKLQSNTPIRAYIPNSKRNCHAIIELQLEGNDENIDEPLKKITLKNANQKIIIKDIKTSTNIKIITETNNILIDNTSQSNLVKGNFNKIYSQARNLNYDEVSIYDENKTTFIEIESEKNVNFSLKIKMIHPVYVTEQNIRLHTVSAFPLEWVKLYGFFCHDFNNKQEWKFLWEKQYNENDRIVYDRITKQFDCETFYIQVKLYGIGVPFVYGFPQEEFATNPAFQTNSNLDKWGRIYGLPRRFYKTHIMEDEEPYTYPPFYNYDIEQDYWFEQRLVNEYRRNDRSVNSTFIKDSDLNNIAVLKCIDPFINDLYVYTETIEGKVSNKHQTDELYPTFLSEDGEGITWKTPYEIENSYSTATKVTLKPQTSSTINTKENQTKTLEIFFDPPDLPKNIKINGMELLLKGHTDLHSDSLILDDRSSFLLPINQTDKFDSIPINNDIQYWEKGKGTYKIGGPTYLFNLQEITRNQIKDGIQFNIGFTNLHDHLKTTIVLYSIKLIIYYEMIIGSYDMRVKMINGREIILNDPNRQSVSMQIEFENTGEIPIVNKNVYIIPAKGLDITNQSFQTFDLDVDENGDNKFVIGKRENDKIIFTPTKYRYLLLKEDDVISKTIPLEVSSDNTELKKCIFEFFYKSEDKAEITISWDNDQESLEISPKHNPWQRFKYEYTTQNNELNDMTFTITVDSGNLLIKDPNQWDSENEIETIEDVKTGIYEVAIFCDEKIIKEEITIRKESEVNLIQEEEEL